MFDKAFTGKGALDKDYLDSLGDRVLVLDCTLGRDCPTWDSHNEVARNTAARLASALIIADAIDRLTAAIHTRLDDLETDVLDIDGALSDVVFSQMENDDDGTQTEYRP